MWKSCQEKTALPHTKCCGEVVVSVYVSWYVCESYVDRFAANFPLSQTILFFRRSAQLPHNELTRPRSTLLSSRTPFRGEGSAFVFSFAGSIWLWVFFRSGFSHLQTGHAAHAFSHRGTCTRHHD